MIANLVLFFIRIYWRTLSPLIGSVCRFQPSCSRYTAVCVERFGAVRGSWLGFVRICKCQPFHPGGYDPPPRRPGDSAGREAPRVVLPGLTHVDLGAAPPAEPQNDSEREKCADGVHSSQLSSNLAPASPPPGDRAGRAPA